MSNSTPHNLKPEPPEDPAAQLRADQIRELGRVRRLQENEDYQAVLGRRFSKAREDALSSFLDPNLSDAELRRVQARFIAVSHVSTLLSDLERALLAAIANHPDPLSAPPPPPEPVPPTVLNAPVGGWFDSDVQIVPQTSPEQT